MGASYVTPGKERTFCIYDGPTPEAIARLRSCPAGARITEIEARHDKTGHWTVGESRYVATANAIESRRYDRYVRPRGDCRPC
jgi:hypothetical protein